jgi:Zn-dependent peptidase ImmA (M78 family)/transcriptional regulator with XRE-family HTH domain
VILIDKSLIFELCYPYEIEGNRSVGRLPMNIDRQELGRRLRCLREGRRYTQEDVAGVLDISRSAVVQMEAGNRSIDSIELMKLSRELGFEPADLFAEEFHEERNPVLALFRKDSALANDKDLTYAVSQWSGLCRQFTTLEKVTGADRNFIGPVLYELPTPRNKWEAIQQGNIIADYERNRLKLGSAPVQDLPEIIEGQGVRVGVLPLDDSISGLFMADEQNGLSVLVNSRHSEQRQMFSYAHEYGHLLFDRQERGVVSRLNDRAEVMEVRANAFAAAFLMPEQGIQKFLSGVGKNLDSPQIQEVYDEEGGAIHAQRRREASLSAVQFYDVVHLAAYFGVSYESALWRLKSLKLISEEARAQLAAQSEIAREFRRSFLDERPPSFPRLKKEGQFQHKLFMLALEAYRLGEISKSKLKEIAIEVEVKPEQLHDFIASVEASEQAPQEAMVH